MLEDLVDVEDAAAALPELLNDAQHEHVRAGQAGKEEGLQPEDAVDIGGARAEEREGEQLDEREQVEQPDAQEGELALHRAEPVAARLPQVLHRLVHTRRHAWRARDWHEIGM